MDNVSVSIVTRHTEAATAAQRWAATYKDYKGFRPGDAERKRDILAQLESLGPTPNPDDVDAIIGNDTWTRRTCDVCSGGSNVAAVVNRESDRDTIVCVACAKTLYGVLHTHYRAVE